MRFLQSLKRKNRNEISDTACNCKVCGRYHIRRCKFWDTWSWKNSNHRKKWLWKNNAFKADLRWSGDGKSGQWRGMRHCHGRKTANRLSETDQFWGQQYHGRRGNLKSVCACFFLRKTNAGTDRANENGYFWAFIKGICRIAGEDGGTAGIHLQTGYGDNVPTVRVCVKRPAKTDWNFFRWSADKSGVRKTAFEPAGYHAFGWADQPSGHANDRVAGRLSEKLSESGCDRVAWPDVFRPRDWRDLRDRISQDQALSGQLYSIFEAERGSISKAGKRLRGTAGGDQASHRLDRKVEEYTDKGCGDTFQTKSDRAYGFDRKAAQVRYKSVSGTVSAADGQLSWCVVRPGLTDRLWFRFEQSIFWAAPHGADRGDRWKRKRKVDTFKNVSWGAAEARRSVFIRDRRGVGIFWPAGGGCRESESENDDHGRFLGRISDLKRSRSAQCAGKFSFFRGWCIQRIGTVIRWREGASCFM